TYWHHGMAGSWAQEGKTRTYHMDVPTNNDFHLRYDTVVMAEGGTWFNMTVQRRGGLGGGYMDTYLLNATGNAVTRLYRTPSSQFNSPITYTYLLDEAGNWTFSIYSNEWTVSYSVTLSWVDQTTGLRMTATHYGVTGTWVGRWNYAINVTAPSPKPFTYDATVYASTGDVVTLTLTTGYNYNNGDWMDFRLVSPSNFIIDQQYTRIYNFYSGISMVNDLFEPGTWRIGIYSTGYWCQYDMDLVITDGTTGTNSTYSHHGSVSIWNAPAWRWYYINVTGLPQQQPFNPGDEAAALMGTRMNLTVQGGAYSNYVEYCFVRLYNPDGRVAAALVRRSDDW
ncbi:MAG: hypothetical protein GWN18_05055, partial [Thermoplasmata archaeon]|nr:hypothetical protein [Thermoplasmata archaeon]NIS11398.1 hypothetical protein [Thermoplasmata archaeon]NIS19334.1 hypothetical protein [Thermoplasmata archaeon]NIT76426.1 hypothetical protein [Thermoplasmata archaeon]NIU48462.1 hypothetical protein [Thermoplasmata archaeon]